MVRSALTVWSALSDDSAPTVAAPTTADESITGTISRSVDGDVKSHLVQQLIPILFTDDQIDGDKLVCLHLLSTFHSDHILPASQTLPTTGSEYGGGGGGQSLIDRLIDRSRKRVKLLPGVPNYLIYTPQYGVDSRAGDRVPVQPVPATNAAGGGVAGGTAIRDSPAPHNVRLLVNEQISKMLLLVLGTLKNCNKPKADHITAKLVDKEYIKTMLMRRDIQNFIYSLKNNPLVCSRKCFKLVHSSRMKVIAIEVVNSCKVLDSIMNSVRRNLLHIRHKRHSSNESLNVYHHQHQHLNMFSVQDSTLHKTANAMDHPPLSNALHGWSSTLRRMRDVTASSLHPTSPTAEESTNSDGTTLSSSGSLMSASGQSGSSPTSSMYTSLTGNSDLTHTHTRGVRVRRFHCAACMEKWRTPHPEPKIMSLRYSRGSVANRSPNQSFLLENLYLKADSMHRIRNMIYKEESDLASYDRRFDVFAVTRRRNFIGATTDVTSRKDEYRMNGADAEPADSRSLEPVHQQSTAHNYFMFEVGSYDMEELKQQISHRETRRRLEKFLQ